MIPKVVIWKSDDRDKLLQKLSLDIDEVIHIDGDQTNIEEFRRWVNESIGRITSRPLYKLIVWSADELTFESQAVLLKPLEELAENLSIYLVVKNENGLMSTIISRCVVEMHDDENSVLGDEYWNIVMDAWKYGPAKCIELSDSLDKEKALLMSEELLYKLKNNLSTGISEKRLLILDETLKLNQELKQRNINIKLVTGDYFLRTWKLIKS